MPRPKDTFEAHPEWGMYTMDAQPMTFAGWLYYMNIAPSCGWGEHIVEEFRSAVQFGFSGIHMDTYGFPKRVWDAQRQPVELEDEFPAPDPCCGAGRPRGSARRAA